MYRGVVYSYNWIRRGSFLKKGSKTRGKRPDRKGIRKTRHQLLRKTFIFTGRLPALSELARTFLICPKKGRRLILKKKKLG